MKTIFLFLVTITTIFNSLSQTKIPKMDWALLDKKIIINNAKKEGFAISFRGPRTFDSPYKVNFKQLSNVWAEGVEGDLDIKLYYFIDFEKNNVSVYDSHRKLCRYDIVRNKIKGNLLKIKIKYANQKGFILINLSNGDFKQITYNKKTKLYSASSHESVYLYPKSKNR